MPGILDIASLKKPEWSKDFRLEADGSEVFPLAVTCEGVIRAKASWPGDDPLLFVLIDPSGEPASDTEFRAGPRAEIRYSVSTADLRKGYLWQVAIVRGPAKEGAHPVLSGKINASAPPPDEALIASELRKLGLSKPSPRPTGGHAPLPDLKPALAAHSEGVHQSLKEISDKMIHRAEIHALQLFQGYPTPPQFQTSLDYLQIGPKPHFDFDHDIGPVHIGAPEILSIVPAEGHPGDHILIHAKDVPSHINDLQVSFVIDPGQIIVYGTVLAANRTQTDVAIEVLVPCRPAATQDYMGKVWVTNISDPTAATHPFTPTKDFLYRAPIVPVLTSVTPAEAGIGQNVVLKGTGLSSGQLYGYFEIDPQQSVQSLSSNTGSGTQQAALPEYRAHQPVTGQVRVKKTIPYCGDLFSNPLPFNYRPSDPFVTEAHFLMNLEIGMIFITPGYSISFNGFSFGNTPGNVWLTCGNLTTPLLQITQWTDQRIEGIVNDILMVYPADVQVTVETSRGRSDPITVTFMPKLRTISLPLSDFIQNYPAQFTIGGQYKDDASSFSPDGLSLIVQHRYGQYDYDDFFAGCSLRNGYMVERMLLTQSYAPGAFVIPTVQPTKNTLIHTEIFWNSGYVQTNLNYQISFIVTGPVGFNPW